MLDRFRALANDRLISIKSAIRRPWIRASRWAAGPAAVIRRLLLPKNKLLVVVGAGASIDFGMPSVEGVADLLSEAAQDQYPLSQNEETNLYRYIESAIADHWRSNAP